MRMKTLFKQEKRQYPPFLLFTVQNTVRDLGGINIFSFPEGRGAQHMFGPENPVQGGD